MEQGLEGVVLKAVGGDIVGMGATGEGLYREVPPEHFGLVERYLRCQLEQTLESYRFCHTSTAPVSEWLMSVCRRENELGNALVDAGVFESKYDKRTSWVLTEVMC